ncbi:MAG: hypothetical protein JSS53_03810, partial [Proteobacteria bacterium]|nr:hypothetical protein [Pseudomonadota bacterium]
SQYKNREFANLEWEADLVKFIEDAIYGIIKKDMPSKLYSVTAVKEVDEVSMNSIQSLRENLTMKVTEQMLLDWRQGKLKGDINDELSSLALKDLKTVSDNISKLVYPIGVLISLKAQSKKTHELKDLLYQAFEKCKALFPDNPAFTQEIAALLSHPVFKDTLQVSGSGFFAQSAVQTDVTRSNPSLSTSSTPSLNN